MDHLIGRIRYSTHMPIRSIPLLVFLGLACSALAEDAINVCGSGHPDATAVFFKAHIDRQKPPNPGRDSFGLMTFATNLDPVQINSLKSIGISVLSHFTQHTYRVRVSKTIAAPPSIIVGGEVPEFCDPDINLKILPALREGQYELFKYQATDGQELNYAVSDGMLNLSVSFYPGVDPAIKRSALLAADIAVPDERYLLNNLIYVRAPPTSLERLAGQNSISWIEPGPPPFFPLMDSVREFCGVNQVQQFVAPSSYSGITGEGVVVGVFDIGIDESAMDFSGRVDHSDTTRIRDHGTHVAGVILGDGTSSRGQDSWNKFNKGTSRQWRGIAPKAHLIETYYLTGSDLSAWYDFIVNQHLDVSNHSYMVDFDNRYGAIDQDRDRIIRGDAIVPAGNILPRLQVFSAGNNGMQPPSSGFNLTGFFSLSSQMKNALVVGNLGVALGRIATTSSLGPTRDGRIKPDVVAPGECVKSVGYCNASQSAVGADYCVGGLSSERRNFIMGMSGTSVSAAVATGIISLGLEAFASAAVGTTPLPSTLRGAAVHTARDLIGTNWHKSDDGWVSAAIGPDFVTGYGALDAVGLVQIMSNRKFLEDSVFHTGDVKRFQFDSNGGAMRITLAWDDPPADPAFSALYPNLPNLVNDLDLVLIAPDGTKHYPWKLDQKITDSSGNLLSDDMQLAGTSINVVREFLAAATPNWTWNQPDDPSNVFDTFPASGLPAAVRGRDHLNNIEVVDVPSATTGSWIVEVSGFNVPSGPQSFSIIGADFHPQTFASSALRIREQFPDLYAFLRMDAICTRAPELCKPRPFWDARTGFRISLFDPQDLLIISVPELCTIFQRTSSLCSPDHIFLKNIPDTVQVGLLSKKGPHIDFVSMKNSRVSIPIERGEGLNSFLVLKLSPSSRGPLLDRPLSIDVH